MKRLALLLAAMGIISAAAMAEAPTLKVTNIGQELEIENQSGDQNVGDTTFMTTVGFEYGDWTFGVNAGKIWKLDTSDGVEGVTSRSELEAWRKFNDNLKLGAKVRFEKDKERYYARYDYSGDLLWSNGDFWYEAMTNNETDNIEVEWFPIGVKYGIFKAGWFVNYWKSVGSINEGAKDEYMEHQLRLYATLYKGEKLTVDTEARVTFNTDTDYKGGNEKAKPNPTDPLIYKDFGRNRLYLGATYAVTESLDIYGKYGYEIRDNEYVKDGKDTDSDSYFGDFIVGWKYKF